MSSALDKPDFTPLSLNQAGSPDSWSLGWRPRTYLLESALSLALIFGMPGLLGLQEKPNQCSGSR